MHQKGMQIWNCQKLNKIDSLEVDPFRIQIVFFPGKASHQHIKRKCLGYSKK